MSDETTRPDEGEAQDTEGHRFNIGLGPNTPDEQGSGFRLENSPSDKDEDTEGHKFNIGLGPNTPVEDDEDTEGHKFNIGLGPNTPDEDKKAGSEDLAV